ncbi:hypothetical protein [Mycolicibacterium lutetiense]
MGFQYAGLSGSGQSANGARASTRRDEYLVAGFSQPQNVGAVKAISARWINDMYHGTDDGIDGAPV